MSRLLWLSNAPWAPSGYGEQTALFTRRLSDAGHDVAVLCNYGLSGRETLFDGITCYPSDGLWGNTNLQTFADRHMADEIVALCDAWVLQPDAWPDGLRASVWTPIDHYPLPVPVLATLKHERITPIAMSRFGEQQMLDCDLDPVYVPHGVDTTLFRPQRELREHVRDELEIPRDVFLVGMVAANTSVPSRKSFPEAFLAFSRFARRHDDAWLYAHTQAKSPAGNGMQLDVLAESCACPQGRLRFPHDAAWQIGMPKQTVAMIYQALDVLLMPSMGEGFGIPLVEAQACGVPVIASDHSAMTENVEAGWLVAGDPSWNEAQKSWQIKPFVAAIDAALEEAYQHRDDGELRERGVAWANNFDADVIVERYWQPLLDREREEAIA